jgi:AcrR family transcriptional regulator
VEAGVAAVLGAGLTDWTVDQVARKAGCAKGLVLYHLKSKDALLVRIADQVGRTQAGKRLLALSDGPRGAVALDRLWAVLVGEVKTGSFGLWVGLLGEPRTRKAAARTAQDVEGLLAAAAKALGVPADSLALPLVPAALDGFCLELLQGNAPEAVRERFDRFWLGVLSDAEG